MTAPEFLTKVFRVIVIKKDGSRGELSVPLGWFEKTENGYDFVFKEEQFESWGYTGKVVMRDKKLEEVLLKISRLLNVKLNDLKGKRRFAELTNKRHEAFWLLREVGGLTYKNIGQIFNRHHSSVIFAVQKVEQRKEDELKYKNYLRHLREDLNDL